MFTFSNSPFHLSKYHTTKSTLYICVFSQYVKAITLSLCALWNLAWPMEPIYQQRASLQPRIYHTVCHTICTQWAVKGNIQTHIIIGDSSDSLKPPHNSIPNSAYARAYLSPWNISFTRALLEQSILGWSEVTHEPGTKRTHLFPAIRPWGTQFNALIGAISELSISTSVSTLTA